MRDERETARAKRKRHMLKTWPPHYADVAHRRKRVEIRRDDRGYAVGDVLWLREWDPATERYTGPSCEVTVTHVLRGGAFGLADGFVALSLSMHWRS